MSRRILAAAALVAALGAGGAASAGSIEVCTDTGAGPGNSGGVTIKEGDVTVTWDGTTPGPGGGSQCLTIDHP